MALPAAARFRPAEQRDLAPSGAVTRVRANIEALATLRTIQGEERPARPEEQAILACWSGWGAVPQVFDESRSDFAWARERLAELLTEAELSAAARSTLNAHYTDAELVKAIWDAAGHMGYTEGRILEPGCGSGNFIGFAPAGTVVTGVEVEPITASIARALYPDAQVVTESFADFRAPEGSYDLVIGNVPFGNVVLHDRRHNPSEHAIHNHFIVKGLHLVRPGGLMLVLTSRFTLDAKNPAARREIAGLADLVGAVRLPSSAHRRAAGTEAITDLLVLRRREPDRQPSDVAWEVARPIAFGEEEAPLNEYFHERPDMVLGELGVGHGMHGPGELLVTSSEPVAPALAAVLARMVESSRERGLTLGLRQGDATSRPAALTSTRTERPDGYLEALPSGGFTCAIEGVAVPHTPPRTEAAELRQLLGLRDCVVALLELEASSINDTFEMDRMRRDLNARYDAYVEAYGPVNRFTLRRTGRTDEESGDERMARVRPRMGGFRSDPFANLVFALEHFDAIEQTAAKADIFRERVVAPRVPKLGADTPDDALAICIDTHGRVELSEIARLLGTDEAGARAALGTLVFDEPGSDRLVPAAEYLSGNVRRKLAEAERAASEDERYRPNVASLREALPPDLGPRDIAARMGAAWIDKLYVEDFLQETLSDYRLMVEHPGGSLWKVIARRDGSVLSTSRWGTRRWPASHVAQALLEQRPVRVYDYHEDHTRTLNVEETAAAQAKADEMAERFAEWAWEGPERASELARTYNERFNSIVLRSYDGAELMLPGLALTFKPHAHQLAAVARIIHEPAVGLYHEVGAGKTAEMVMGCMELRRLGLVKKPTFVVPNHMLEQFSREFQQLYPLARILACHKEDLERENRRLFVARCATGNWDAVIMTESAFQRIPMSKERQEAYHRQEVSFLRAQLKRAREAEEKRSVKELEKAVLRAEERIKKLLDSDKDPGVTFEQTGIDYLFRDEGHRDKNLRTPSNIPGAGIDGSQRASDMHMKLSYLREKHPARWGTRATATPIANSIAEMYTETRYQRPDLLAESGIEEFDVWAATFGETVTGIEVAPDGSGFRMKSRFARFTNVPELLKMFRTFGDVKTGEDLKLHTPLLAIGPSGERAPETVVVAPSDELRAFMAELADRADQVRQGHVDPTVDNMLKVSTDGRQAALDLRLVGRGTHERGKIEAAADRIVTIWSRNRNAEYLGPDGRPHSVTGSLQIIFSDLGTPRDGEWNVYDELRDQLVARGMPRQAVRFIHEARNDQEKGELFAACRNGQVAVLVGSTERMGVGTNVQDRAVALHHLDCPWRPADLHQREGRILRQGNQNREVRIVRYVTEASFDGFIWGTVERKASFIAQVMRGRLDVREVEDIGDEALTYQQVKALATGQPLLLEQAEAEAQLTKLERLKRAHANEQSQLRWSIEGNQMRIRELGGTLAGIDAAIAGRRDTRGDLFIMEVGGQTTSKRPDAETLLRRALVGLLAVPRFGDDRPTRVGSLGGFEVMAEAHPDTVRPGVKLSLSGVPGPQVDVLPGDLEDGSLVRRLEYRLTNLEHFREDTASGIERLRGEVARAEGLLGKPFPHTSRLNEARAKVHDILEQLAEVARRYDGGSAPCDEANGQVADDSEEERRVLARLAPASTPPAPMCPVPSVRVAGSRTA